MLSFLVEGKAETFWYGCDAKDRRSIPEGLADPSDAVTCKSSLSSTQEHWENYFFVNWVA